MSDGNLVIWKQALRPGLQQYMLPEGAKLLSVAMQRGEAMLWFLCSPAETAKKPRSILFTGTGHDFSAAPYRFIGTILTEDQSLVFHVLEAIDPMKAMIASILGQEMMP